MSALSRGQWIGGMLGVAVIGAIVAGMMVAGSPQEARVTRLDLQRLRGLSDLSVTANGFNYKYRRLPASLDELRRDQPVQPAWTDPTTNAPYEYRVLDPSSYEVCATFERNAEKESDWQVSLEFRAHHRGRYCFRRTAPRPPAPR